MSRSIAQVPAVSPAAGVATAADFSVGLMGLVGFVGHALLTTQGLGVARSMARLFADGALSNIVNPKIAVFESAFLPQFVQPQAGHPTLTIFVSGLLFVLITLAVKVAEQQDRVNLVLLMAAGVKPGARLLDLASGAGEPAMTASRLLGSEGQVTATDLSAPVVAALSERVARHGLSNVLCQKADREALPFADASFDAVTCRYGLMYATDPARTVAEAARALRAGSRLAFMVWGPEANNSLLFHGLRAANEFLGRPLAEVGFKIPTRFAQPGLVAGLLAAARLDDRHAQEIQVEPKIKVGVPFWLPLLEMNVTEVWKVLAPEQQRRVHQVITQACEPFRSGDHHVLKTHMRIISGARPAAAA